MHSQFTMLRRENESLNMHYLHRFSKLLSLLMHVHMTKALSRD